LAFTPREFLGRLAALAPPPRLHLIPYHGLLAPHAANRALIVATPPAAPTLPVPAGNPPAHVSPARRQPLAWAAPIARVFEDATDCR
jgi:hypothetical protein